MPLVLNVRSKPEVNYTKQELTPNISRWTPCWKMTDDCGSLFNLYFKRYKWWITEKYLPVPIIAPANKFKKLTLIQKMDEKSFS